MKEKYLSERSDFYRNKEKNLAAVSLGKLSAAKRLKNKTPAEISLIMSEVRRGKR